MRQSLPAWFEAWDGSGEGYLIAVEWNERKAGAACNGVNSTLKSEQQRAEGVYRPVAMIRTIASRRKTQKSGEYELLPFMGQSRTRST